MRWERLPEIRTEKELVLLVCAHLLKKPNRSELVVGTTGGLFFMCGVTCGMENIKRSKADACACPPLLPNHRIKRLKDKTI